MFGYWGWLWYYTASLRIFVRVIFVWGLETDHKPTAHASVSKWLWWWKQQRCWSQGSNKPHQQLKCISTQISEAYLTIISHFVRSTRWYIYIYTYYIYIHVIGWIEVYIHSNNWLVNSTSLKNMKFTWDTYPGFPNIWKIMKNKVMFQTTHQI